MLVPIKNCCNINIDIESCPLDKSITPVLAVTHLTNTEEESIYLYTYEFKRKYPFFYFFCSTGFSFFFVCLKDLIEEQHFFSSFKYFFTLLNFLHKPFNFFITLSMSCIYIITIVGRFCYQNFKMHIMFT